jgi:molybdate transport system ATP-binding protein
VTVGTFSIRASFDARPDEVVIIVGPNGAGKSTLIRALAGLQPIGEGAIVLDGNVLDDATSRFVAPQDRRVGYVPQSESLFPHLTVRANVGFGSRCRGVRRTEADEEAMRWLSVVGLEHLADRRPADLSGGEAKRVALARALATRPRLLLFDEPFAGLDASGRTEIRRELRGFLQEHDGCSVLVTHDPIDALALGDRIVVLESGQVVQDVAPNELRVRPRSRYVADLVGVNLYRGAITARGLLTDGGTEIVAASEGGSGPGFATIHPRAVALHVHAPEGSPRNVFPGRVAEVEPQGERVRVRVTGALDVVAEVTRSSVAELGLVAGAAVFATVKATEIEVYAS